MKDEMLENIKADILYCYKDWYITEEQYKRDLDYITNLQEENKEWQMIFDTFSKRPYAHRYLEEKKKELGNDKIIGLDSEMVYKDYYDCKTRNEEATNYLLDKYVTGKLDDEEVNNVVRILKGE